MCLLKFVFTNELTIKSGTEDPIPDHRIMDVDY